MWGLFAYTYTLLLNGQEHIQTTGLTGKSVQWPHVTLCGPFSPKLMIPLQQHTAMRLQLSYQKQTLLPSLFAEDSTPLIPVPRTQRQMDLELVPENPRQHKETLP